MLYFSSTTMFKKLNEDLGTEKREPSDMLIFIGNEAEVCFLDTDTRNITQAYQ